jgi:hypothetical protein
VDNVAPVTDTVKQSAPKVMATLSLRRLWIIYKRTTLKSGSSQRERLNTQLAFYTGALGVLKVLSYLMERGDYEELHTTIRREGRLIDRIQKKAAPAPEAALKAKSPTAPRGRVS